MKRVLLSMFAVALSICAAVPLAAQSVQEMQALIEAPRIRGDTGVAGLTLAQLMTRAGAPGVSVAVIKDFEVHWAKGYGLADVVSGRAVDTGTLFQAASISKPVAAMAAMRLVQDGRFSLDQDVNQILKSWKVPTSELTRVQPVTPRSLMSHTSGANDGFGFPGYAPGAPLPTLPQILNHEQPSNVGAFVFARPPYQGYLYSGGAVTLMQLALMDLTGEPFARMMQRLVLGPLKMTNSTYEQPIPASLASRAARNHDAQGKARDATWHVYPEQAAAGLWTTPTDLARFIIEVQKAVRGPAGEVLSMASAKEMVTPVSVGPYAVGLSIAKRGEGWYFSHTGSNRGFRALIVGHMRKGYGLVVMVNSDGGGQVYSEIEQRVIKAYKWDVLDGPIPRP
jgi:CubicO group peptidase (beta-lactamase class C family)